MHENLKAAIDEYGSVDEQIKVLTKRKEALRNTLMEAVVGSADTANLSATLETDAFVVSFKTTQGALRLSKEALEEDGIDTSQYMVRGRPYITLKAQRRGQRL